MSRQYNNHLFRLNSLGVHQGNPNRLINLVQMQLIYIAIIIFIQN